MSRLIARPVYQRLSHSSHPYKFTSLQTKKSAVPVRRKFTTTTTPLPRVPDSTSRASQNSHTPIRSSYSSYTLITVIAVCGSAFVYDYFVREQPQRDPRTTPEPVVLPLLDDLNPDFSKMPIPEGTLGNLTPEQEQKLKEFWALTLKTFGVVDPSHPNGSPAVPHHTAAAPVHEPETPERKKKSKRLSLFSRSHDTEPTSPSSTKSGADEDDKYGQTKELKEILATQSPESLHTAFWTTVKTDHPDVLLLRYLRARKWDVDRALAMAISTLSWRTKEMQVDEDVILKGEGQALIDSSSSDANVKREGKDFLTQFRMGKSFLHGTDKEGRPICVVRARLHRGGEQTEKALERFTVHMIETGRITLQSPVETSCIVFDMTHFTLANMDYTPVKFMIKIFEANYPESLGTVLVHKAPWVFQGIWKIIRGWLDPVVAAKVSFTNSAEDMEQFIARKQIIKELGGDEDWEYKYIEPVEGENDAMKDTASRDRILDERKKLGTDYETKTFAWIAATDASEKETLRAERNEIAKQLCSNYWQLDPYVRARSIYDRTGMIGKGGKIDFYPSQTLKPENVNGIAVPAVGTHSDDVD